MGWVGRWLKSDGVWLFTCNTPGQILYLDGDLFNGIWHWYLVGDSPDLPRNLSKYRYQNVDTVLFLFGGLYHPINCLALHQHWVQNLVHRFVCKAAGGAADMDVEVWRPLLGLDTAELDVEVMTGNKWEWTQQGLKHWSWHMAIES